MSCRLVRTDSDNEWKIEYRLFWPLPYKCMATYESLNQAKWYLYGFGVRKPIPIFYEIPKELR